MSRAAAVESLTRPVEERLRRAREDLGELEKSLRKMDRFIKPELMVLRSRILLRNRRELESAFTRVQVSFDDLLDEVMTETDANSAPRAERAGQIEDIAEVAATLQNRLGQRVTAYLSGVKDPKMVGRWARGKVKPRQLAELRLRAAYPVAALLVEAYGPDTARAWFFGTNSRLNDEAPAYLLRHGEPPFRDLLSAAQAFVEGEFS